MEMTRIRAAVRQPPLATVDGRQINVATMDQAVDAIGLAAESRQSFSVFTLNLDHLVKLRQHPDFEDAYANADFVTADGAPVAALARRQNDVIERTAGADLVLPVAREASRRGIPVFLFGTTMEVLRKAGSVLQAEAGNTLTIAGMDAPEHSFEPDSAEADAAIARIAASGAGLCLVALGAPKQELFAARAKARGVNCGFICIGAALDFLAGEQVRAPMIMRRWKLEWLWRLLNNPRRLAARYARCALLLAEIAFRAPSRRHAADPQK